MKARAEPACNLALLRIAVAAIILISPEGWAAVRSAQLARSLRVVPEGLGWLFALVPVDALLARGVRWLLLVAAIATLLGLYSRLSSALLALACLYTFGLYQLSGSVTHDMHLLWFAALLAVSPCGDALSLDRWLAARRGQPAADPSPAYWVPLQAVRALLGVIYFFPGFWKLATSGLAWITSDNLRDQMHWKWYQMSWQPPALRIDQHPVWLHVGACGVVLFELGFGVLALRASTRWLAAGLGLLFHGLTEIFLGLPFVSLWGCYVVLFDWSGLLPRSTAPRAVLPRSAWPALALGALLFVSAALQGARNATQAWPFACYPTFQWMPGDAIPDLRIEALLPDGQVRVIPDGPSSGGVRSQHTWGAVWRIVGVYGDAPRADALHAYWAWLRQSPRAAQAAKGAVELRFYRAYYAVAPERRGAPPLHAILIARTPP